MHSGGNEYESVKYPKDGTFKNTHTHAQNVSSIFIRRRTNIELELTQHCVREASETRTAQLESKRTSGGFDPRWFAARR